MGWAAFLQEIWACTTGWSVGFWSGLWVWLVCVYWMSKAPTYHSRRRGQELERRRVNLAGAASNFSVQVPVVAGWMAGLWLVPDETRACYLAAAALGMAAFVAPLLVMLMILSAQRVGGASAP